jgi:hypothetical protein
MCVVGLAVWYWHGAIHIADNGVTQAAHTLAACGALPEAPLWVCHTPTPSYFIGPGGGGIAKKKAATERKRTIQNREHELWG